MVAKNTGTASLIETKILKCMCLFESAFAVLIILATAWWGPSQDPECQSEVRTFFSLSPKKTLGCNGTVAAGVFCPIGGAVGGVWLELRGCKWLQQSISEVTGAWRPQKLDGMERGDALPCPVLGVMRCPVMEEGSVLPRPRLMCFAGDKTDDMMS